MKISLVLIFAGMIHVSASVYSQNTKLSLAINGKSLRDLFREIEKQSKFHFLYNADFIDLDRTVTLNQKNCRVEEVLDQIFKNAEVSYRVMDNNLIVITPAELNQKQQKTVTGTITDATTGEPIPGVSVAVENMAIGVVSDINGKYTIEVPNPDAVLSYTFIGYLPEKIRVENQSVIDIKLSQDIKKLEEIVVIGYGIQKKKLTTGATLQVKGDDIKKQNTVYALTALQGVTPGVQIIKSSGQPGEGFKVNIRGLGTTGNATPLYVVDGVPMGNIDYLSTADIESIDVLKDAASAAIYGARAANGVVLVTTRQGRTGKPVITYDGYYGVQNLYKKAPLLNAQEYAVIMNEGRINDGLAPYDFASLVPDWDKIENGTWKGTNWLDEITVKDAPVQNHTLNITGGGDQSIYSIGLSYLKQDGILGKPVASHYDRYNLRVNTSHTLAKWLKVGENLTYMYSERSGIGIGNIYYNDIHNTLVTSPLLPNRDASGNYHYAIDWNLQEPNPIGIMEYERGTNLSKNHQLAGNVFIELQPVKNLTLKSSFGYTLNVNSYRAYVPEYKLADGNNTQNYNEVTHNLSSGIGWLWENTLTYNFNVQDKHHFTVMAGTTAQKYNLGDSINGYNHGSIFNDLEHAYLRNTKISSSYTTLVSNPWGEGAIQSYFGRLSYDYKEKYLLTVVMRADASSNFAKGNRWGYFPSVSAGWLVTSEPFMQDAGKMLSFLKLRASWGQNGNQNIPTFQYLATISFDNANYYTFGPDKGSQSTGAYANILPNKNIKWETSEQVDIGLDARFINNQLSFTLDWYNKMTKDWLVNPPALASYGTGAPFINGGDVRNRGIELGLGWNHHIGELNYHINATFAYNKNKVTRINNNEKILHGPTNVLSQGTDEMFRAQVGFPIGYFWGYKTLGLFQNEAEVKVYKNSKGTVIMPNAQPGDIRFADLNDDGVIDEKDKTQIGDPNPHYIFGFTIGTSYKGFDLSILANGVAGNQIAKSYRSSADSPKQNYTTDILERWHGEGTSNKLPRLTSGTSINSQYISDLYIEDGDYLKISNVTFGYDFKKLVKKLPFTQARLYVAAQNLYTFTKYSGMDPEIGYAPNTSGTTTFGKGIDLGYYPSPRTYMVGVSVTF